MFTPSFIYFELDGAVLVELFGPNFPAGNCTFGCGSIRNGKLGESNHSARIASSSPVTPICDLRTKFSSWLDPTVTSVIVLPSFGLRSTSHFCGGAFSRGTCRLLKRLWS